MRLFIARSLVDEAVYGTVFDEPVYGTVVNEAATERLLMMLFMER